MSKYDKFRSQGMTYSLLEDLLFLRIFHPDNNLIVRLKVDSKLDANYWRSVKNTFAMQYALAARNPQMHRMEIITVNDPGQHIWLKAIFKDGASFPNKVLTLNDEQKWIAHPNMSPDILRILLEKKNWLEDRIHRKRDEGPCL